MTLLPDAVGSLYFLTSCFLIQACLVIVIASATKAAVLPSDAVDSSPSAPGKSLPMRELSESFMRREMAVDKSGSLGNHVVLDLEDRLARNGGRTGSNWDGARVVRRKRPAKGAMLGEVSEADGRTDDAQEQHPDEVVETPASEQKVPEIYEFVDKECKNSTGGVKMPDQADLEEGSCVRCSDLIQKTKETETAMGLPVNAMISCSEEGDATLSRIFGEDCKYGEETSHDFEMKKDQALKFGDGECVKATRTDTKVNYWLKMDNPDKLAKKASCITSPASSSTKSIIIFVIIGGSVLLASSILLGGAVVVKKRRQKKKGDTIEGTEDEAAGEDEAEGQEGEEEADDAAAETETPADDKEGKKKDAKTEKAKEKKEESGGLFESMGF